MQEYISDLLRQWHLPKSYWNVILIAVAIILGIIIKTVLSYFIRRNAAAGKEFSLVHSIITHMGGPLSYFIPLFILNILVPLMQLPPVVLHRLSKTVEIGLIVTFAWLLIRSIKVVQDYVLHRFDYAKANNLRERKIRTQLIYLRQVLTGLIVLLTIAAVLLSFSAMRRIGAGLLTGVGIGGIVVGFAAQRSLANLLAGFQIAFTQPIRIDDVVVVEGEWGRVEEITLTYVVVLLWDERRLILPITYFIEKPFQNWTRTGSNLIGSVFIYADYNLPVDQLRLELDRLVKDHPLWDGRVKAMQVTNATDSVIEIRTLVSAQSSGAAFDLRCFVREGLVAFINREFPQCLPRTRTELDWEKNAEQEHRVAGSTSSENPVTAANPAG
jgi:small-conductance mechanosensitive channel